MLVAANFTFAPMKPPTITRLEGLIFEQTVG